ncbi:MAG TPA: hypothetical protein VM778_10830 [Gemmatimonadota bacterium]|nr:hypothetical protein [Gemmatimonadota bacterium]
MIGSSFSGLLVSLALSRAGIEHVVVGGPEPPRIPRLGESLNECAAPELWRLFQAEMPGLFFPKSHISLLNGEYATMAKFGDPHRSFGGDGEEANGSERRWMNVLSHVDRVELDPEVYRRARAEPACRFVEDRVAALDFDPGSDRVRGLTLESGESLHEPRYVFDATGYRGVVANPAGVGIESISDLQRVVWTHHLRKDGPAYDRWWHCGTNMLRLEERVDGLDGISWMIPIGRRLSVGISVDGARTEPAEEIIRLLDAAFARRGVDYRAEYPDTEEKPLELRHKYFVRERAYGANWLLAGGTFVSIWFPSSSGLWTAVAAAGMAPRLLEEPLKAGASYESMMRELVAFHRNLDEMIGNGAMGSRAEGYEFWATWLSRIPRRLSHYIRVRRGIYESWRPLPGLMSGITRVLLDRPGFHVSTGGFYRIHVEHRPDLVRQGEAFEAYFDKRRFRRAGRRAGLREGLRLLRRPVGRYASPR